MRRAAPGVLVLGTLLLVLSTGTAALAQAVSQARSDAHVATLVVDRLAYLAIANLTVWVAVLIALWRWSGTRITREAERVVGDHDRLAGAHKLAAAENHRPLESALADLDRGMADVLGEVKRIAAMVQSLPEMDRRLRALEEDHAAMTGRRDPHASPRRCRISDPDGDDHADERGQG
jgi:hypothetical protein